MESHSESDVGRADPEFEVSVSATGTIEGLEVNDEVFPVDGQPFLIIKRVSFDTVSGTLEGTAVESTTISVNLGEGMATLSLVMTFRGSIDGSDPGTMTLIATGNADLTTDPVEIVGTLVVVEGSAFGGLAGACGGGIVEGETVGEDRFILNYDLVIAFGDECDDLNFSEIPNMLSE